MRAIRDERALLIGRYTSPRSTVLVSQVFFPPRRILFLVDCQNAASLINLINGAAVLADDVHEPLMRRNCRSRCGKLGGCRGMIMSRMWSGYVASRTKEPIV